MYLYPEDIEEMVQVLRGSMPPEELPRISGEIADALEEMRKQALREHHLRASISVNISAARGYALPRTRMGDDS